METGIAERVAVTLVVTEELAVEVVAEAAVNAAAEMALGTKP